MMTLSSLRHILLSVVLMLGCLIPVRAALTDGLILHYDFESITGTSVWDASHHSADGTLMGNAVIEPGQSGNGATFLTATDYLQMPNGIINNLTSFSITAWVKINALNTWSRIFDFGSDQSYNMFLCPQSGNGTLRFAMKNGGAEQLIDAQGPLKTNEWVHVAVTYFWGVWTGTGSGRLYVNGVLAGTNNAFTINPSLLPATTQNYLAKSQYPDPALNGIIDDFRVYNRELSESEILEISGIPEAVNAAYNSIVIEGNLSQVVSDVALPTITPSGGYPIVWTSSAPDVVSITGKVTRPLYFDQIVTLTAHLSISIEGKTFDKTKTFDLTVPASQSQHWESLILENDTWKYRVGNSEPPSGWYLGSFDDASWSSGPGGFGFADGDDNTTIPSCTSVYLRRQIQIADASKIDALVLDIDYDDAFVFYVNGVECARSSNITGTFPAYNATVSTDHEASMYSGGTPTRFILKPSSLVNGANTFAVQVLNIGISSTDLSSRIFVSGRMQGSGIAFHEVPSWFTVPVDYGSSNLPFILVETSGQSIIQNTKIMADMKVLNSPLGFNSITDTNYEYNGKIGIEIRGNTSAGFPKKSYTVETRTDTATNLNVSLLGMPEENDWVFHGPYPDKSLMRNVLAYHLGNLTGKWSPRTRFFELYLNGNYQGVYALVEKIKIDNDRLDLAKLKAADTTGNQLTGGYILKIDRPEWATDVVGLDYWISPYRAWTSLQQKVYFLFHYPKGGDLAPQQRTYIEKHLTAFENAMYSDNYQDKETGFYPMVDLTSFLDYYIINELARNLDGYRISTFIHKDKDSKGGKITMGPYWDYDICFGNADFFQAGQTEGWIIDGMGNADDYAMPFWWEKFRLDPYFNAKLKVRWNEWTAKYLNVSYLNAFIDSCSYELKDAQQRNFQTWNVLSTYVWPNNYVGGSYANELSYLKSWLNNRLIWMDGQIQAIQDLPDALTSESFPMDLVTYPNPFRDEVHFKFHLNEVASFELRITDLLGKTVLIRTEQLEPGVHEFPLTTSDLGAPSKVYLYQVRLNGKVRKAGKLVRF